MLLSALLIHIYASLFGRRVRFIPQPDLKVILAFRLKHPGAKSTVWKQTDFNRWQVSFKFRRAVYWSLYTSGGNWLETRHGAIRENIPKKIQEDYGLKYNVKDIKDISKIQTPLQTIFEIHKANGLFDVKLLYDEDGKLLGRMKF